MTAFGLLGSVELAREEASMHDRPVARAEGMVQEDLDGDIVIYDTANQVGHCLSADAAAVWSRCDGNSATEDIAKAVSQPVESVALALGQLAEAGLLEQGPLAMRQYSRREVASRAAKLGGAAISAPLILSVAIPSAASAASRAANGTTQTALQCPALATGTKFIDASCASNTCYYAQGGGVFVRFCAPATCAVLGAKCTTYADCCAGAFTSNPQYNQACQSGTCAA